MVLVGGILIILSASIASTSYMIDADIPQKLFEIVASVVSSQTSFLILLLIFLLILGAILDIFSAIMLIVPLILPANCRRIRNKRSAFGDRLSRRNAARLPDAAGGPESIYCQLPV